MSQRRLARLSGISRFKICTYELGDASPLPAEENRLIEALRAEAERLRNISLEIDFTRVSAVGSSRESNGR
jgi:predicted transcriptional regulator